MGFCRAVSVALVLFGLWGGGGSRALAQLDPADPWPKHGQNALNNFRAPQFGAHSKPVMRWWANGGTAAAVGYPNIVPGTAIGYFGPSEDRVRCAVIPGNVATDCVEPSPSLQGTTLAVVIRVFRFHPCEPYDVEDPAPPVWEFLVPPPDCAGEQIGSAPLILANDTVIFQTTRRLVCCDFSALTASSICDSPPQPPATAAWVYPDTSDFVSICASPVLASSREVSGVDLIFAHGNDGLLALTPSGTLVDFEAMLSCDSGFTTPAIGPIHDDDPEDPDDRNLAYVSLFDLGNPSCQAGDPKMFGFVADDFATNVAVSINDGPQLFRIGSGASPTLRDDGVCVIPSDDGWVYAIENTTTMARIWRIRPPGIIAGDSYSFSASAAVFPDGNLICWDEYSTVSLINSEGVVWGSRVLSASTWIGGSSAADRLRWYNPHAWRAVRCYANDVEFDEELLPPYPFKRVWGYLPPEPLRVPLVGAPAIDGDGTLIFQSGSHILALRPLLADFNGDGCRNNFDGDSLAQLLTYPAQWQTEIGDVLGINGLGVCDCNNDGVCNNFDIDCAVDLILYGPTQCGEPAFTPDDGEPKDEEESSQFSGSGGFGEAESMEQAAAEPSTSSSPAEAYLEEFLAIIAGLRTYFEME